MKIQKLLHLGSVSLFAFLLTLVPGCNDNPAPTQKIMLDLRDLQSQMGILPPSSHSRLSSPLAGSSVHSEIKALIIGPLTFRNHTKPYSINEPVDDKFETDFENDVPNTSDFLKIIPLPTEEEFVEFEVPAISDGWQVLAAGIRTLPDTLQDLGEKEHDDTLAYVGFTEHSFLTPAELAESGVSLKLKRACASKSLPKGCATFNDKKKAQVSASVEIVGLMMNDVEVTSKVFPIVIRTDAQANTAEDVLETLVVDKVSDIKKLVVLTAHKLNPAESTACQALSETPTVQQLKTNCEIQEYPYVYGE